MKNITTVMENLIETLDIEAFVKGVQEFDRVTQRQCLMKALKELRKPGTVGLHGQERVKTTVRRIREILELEGQVVSEKPPALCSATSA